jgi:hypothetical protein
MALLQPALEMCLLGRRHTELVAIVGVCGVHRLVDRAAILLAAELAVVHRIVRAARVAHCVLQSGHG